MFMYFLSPKSGQFTNQDNFFHLNGVHIREVPLYLYVTKGAGVGLKADLQNIESSSHISLRQCDQTLHAIKLHLYTVDQNTCTVCGSMCSCGRLKMMITFLVWWRALVDVPSVSARGDRIGTECSEIEVQGWSLTGSYRSCRIEHSQYISL